MPSTEAAAGATRATAGVVVGLLVLLVVLAAGSLFVGSRPIAPADAIAAVFGQHSGPASAVIQLERIPRALLAMLVGAGLGVAGTLMQGITRNPLAEPGLLGLGAAGAFAIVICTSIAGTPTSGGRAVIALLGAAVATIVVLAGAGGRVDPTRLLLVGVAVTAVLTGVTSAVALGDPATFDGLRAWLVGSTATHGYQVAGVTATFVVPGLVLATALGRALDVHALGTDVAAGLGSRPLLVRLAALIAVAMLAGPATAAAGPILFLGLLAPHVASRLLHTHHRAQMLLAALLGGLVLLIADVLGRIVGLGAEIPAGIVVAVVGAPVLVLAARRIRDHR